MIRSMWAVWLIVPKTMVVFGSRGCWRNDESHRVDTASPNAANSLHWAALGHSGIHATQGRGTTASRLNLPCDPGLASSNPVTPRGRAIISSSYPNPLSPVGRRAPRDSALASPQLRFADHDSRSRKILPAESRQLGPRVELAPAGIESSANEDCGNLPCPHHRNALRPGAGPGPD